MREMMRREARKRALDTATEKALQAMEQRMIQEENDVQTPEATEVQAKRKSDCYQDGDWDGILVAAEISDELKKVRKRAQEYINLINKANPLAFTNNNKLVSLKAQFESEINGFIGAVDEAIFDRLSHGGRPYSSTKRRGRFR